MSSSPLELSPEQLGRLLRFPDLDFVEPGLWRLKPGSIQTEMDSLAGVEVPEPRELWLRLEAATAPPEAPSWEVRLPAGSGFLAPALEPPSQADAALVVPGELVGAEPMLVYLEAPEGSPGEVDLPESGARVRLSEAGTSGLLMGSRRLLCQVRDQHGQWPVEVLTDPSGSGEPLALCPLCDHPADRWYSCARHGPHCSAHRKVCRSCMRGECALCFHTRCGTCEAPLCPDCAVPACSCGDHGSCLAHRDVCSECQGSFCKACSGGTCAIGETPLCRSCAGTCSACGRTVRTRLIQACVVCAAQVCPDCSDACFLDGRILCPAHQATCGECSRALCPTHAEICQCCGAAQCRGHLERCPICSRPTCPSCRKSGACRQCRSLQGVGQEERQRLRGLGQGRPWGGSARIRGASGPHGWLFALGVGLHEFRVATDPEVTQVRSEHRRPLLGRVLGRG